MKVIKIWSWLHLLHPLLVFLKGFEALCRDELCRVLSLVKPQMLHDYSMVEIRPRERLCELGSEQVDAFLVGGSARDSVDLECVWVVAEDVDWDAAEAFDDTRDADQFAARDIVFVLVLKLVDFEYHCAML